MIASSILRVLTATWCDWMAVDIAGDGDEFRELLLLLVVGVFVDVGWVGEE